MIRHHQLAKKRHTVPIPEVQILGSLIGTGLSDTGTADATNLLVSTQQAFAGLDWIPTFITANDSGVTDPNSTTTASTLTEVTGGSSPRHNIFQGFSVTPSVQYSAGVYLKQGIRTRAALVLSDSSTAGAANYALVTFDLAGGVIGVAAAANGNFSGASATITAKSNGFYLCTLTATVNANGNYTIQIFADAGSGSGAANLNYAGNASAPALTVWGAGVWAGAAGTYVPLNANAGAAASTIQQAFSPNGGTTAYWGTRTNNAWVGVDATIPVQWTRHRFAPRPSATSGIGQWPWAPDYASTIDGSLVQTDVADSTFASPTTVDTLPATGALPYYPRYWLSERTVTAGAAARYARFLPPASSFGGLSEWQVFAKASPLAPARPAQPTISPNGGRFPGLSAVVTMTSLTPGASIYYTTDGTTPAPATSRKYIGPIILSIGSGSTVTVKAVAHLNTLSTPLSLVTTSQLFCGFGFKPNDNWYDTIGNLIEAHSGSAPIWDPNSSAYYLVGQFMNINTVLHSSTTPEPNFAPAVYLYKSTDQMNWTNLGPILDNSPFASYPITGNYNLLYNAANNNYVILGAPVKIGGTQSSLFYASTSGSNIQGPWAWNQTPIVPNTFFNFATLVDSDGVTVYATWRDDLTHTYIQQLNSSYTGLTGSPLILTSTTLREGFAFFKWPNVTGGTYFIISGAANAYNSSVNIDLRYIYNQGSSPLVNSWNTHLDTGADAWNGFTANGTNYNGQLFASAMPQGTVQPFVTMDYWDHGAMYGSRQVWLPLTMTKTSAVITHPASWDPSQLATTYTLNTLTLSASTFQVGATQGTVIGTVGGYLIQSWVSLTDSHSGAVQLVGGVLQVGATPPGTAGSFNISLTETPNIGSPHVTVISITESAVSPQLSGSVVTFTTTQAINLTTLGVTDWAAFGYTAGPTSIERKATGGSLISTLTQVGAIALQNFNNASFRNFSSTWTDGTPDASVSNEDYIVFCPITSGQGPGPGMSFTVPADTSLRTLDVYVSVSNNTFETTTGHLTATLSDSSAGPYSDTSVGTISSDTGAKLGHYTITYEAGSGSQFLTVTWINGANPAHGQNVQLFAATLTGPPPSIPIASVAMGTVFNYSANYPSQYGFGDTLWNTQDGSGQIWSSMDDCVNFNTAYNPPAGSNFAICKWTTDVGSTSVGTQINSMAAWGQATQTGSDGATYKNMGMICVGGALYTFACRQRENFANGAIAQTSFNAQIITDSGTAGVTWTPAPPSTANPYVSPMFPSSTYANFFGCPSFVNFGANYAGNTDGYVYAISGDGNSSGIMLSSNWYIARVLATNLPNLNASQWSFWNGSSWGAVASATPIITSTNNMWGPPSVQYFPSIDRFLMVGAVWPLSIPPFNTSSYIFPSAQTYAASTFTFYEAPGNGGKAPTGPWTKVGSFNWNNLLSGNPPYGNGWYLPAIMPASVSGDNATILCAGNYNSAAVSAVNPYSPHFITFSISPNTSSIYVPPTTNLQVYYLSGIQSADIVLASGTSLISQINDLSGNGNNATQGTSADQPAYEIGMGCGPSSFGLNGIFAGLVKNMAMTSPVNVDSAYTCYMVAAMKSAKVCAAFGNAVAPNTSGILIIASTSGNIFTANSSGHMTFTGAPTTGLHVWAVTMSGSTGTLYVDGVAQSAGTFTSGGAQGATVQTIGGYENGANGTTDTLIGSLLLYNTVHSAGTIAAISAGLAANWGCPSTGVT